MKKSFVTLGIVALLVFSSSVALGFGNIDGHTWNNLEKREKELYVFGLLDGFNLGTIFLLHETFDVEVDVDLFAMQLKREGELLEFQEDELEAMINNLDDKFKEDPDQSLIDLALAEGIM